MKVDSVGTSRLQLPPKHFYWAVLEVPASAGRNGHLRTRLGYLFENVLPEPIEQVQAAYWRLGRQSTYLACGMNIDRLKKATRDHLEALTGPEKGAEVVHVGPDALPEFLSEQIGHVPVPLERLNLLRDEFEPPAVRRSRNRLMLILTLIVMIMAGTIAFGFERRVRAKDRQTEAINSLRRQLIANTIGLNSGSQQPPDVQLIAELRRLRQSRGTQGAHDGPDRTLAIDPRDDDCALILADILGHWPPDVLMMTESVVITPTSIVIRGAAPASQYVQEFADAIGMVAKSNAEGQQWVLQQPQVNAGSSGVQATVQLSKARTKVGPP